mmetsp:Transcript_45960/g.72643  ORF Transcript_45960/g.72643 Transcript_45960/m.72643 type:complete len:88 (-) Transcript_45960:132-395(-)
MFTILLKFASIVAKLSAHCTSCSFFERSAPETSVRWMQNQQTTNIFRQTFVGAGGIDYVIVSPQLCSRAAIQANLHVLVFRSALCKD